MFAFRGWSFGKGYSLRGFRVRDCIGINFCMDGDVFGFIRMIAFVLGGNEGKDSPEGGCRLGKC